jgi:hypothetical protein
MGSWNSTCGISNLPIEYGDEVKVVFLKNKIGNEKIGANNPIGGCYPTDYWTPISLPFSATYADYGRAENFQEELPAKMFVEQMEAMLKRDELEIHPDIMSKDSPETIEHVADFCDYVERGRVAINKQLVSFTLIHKKIWEGAVKAEKINEIAKDYDLYLESLFEEIKEERYESTTTVLFAESRHKKKMEEFAWSHIAAFFRDSYLHREITGACSDALIESIRTEKCPKTELTEAYKDLIVNFTAMSSALMGLRRPWAPPLCGTGSQHTGWEEHLELNKATRNLILSKIQEEKEDQE